MKIHARILTLILASLATLQFAEPLTAWAQVGIPRFVQNLTVRGDLTIQGAFNFISSSLFNIQADDPGLTIYDADASADNGKWVLRADSETLKLEAWNDAFDSQESIAELERTDTTPTTGFVNLSSFGLLTNRDATSASLYAQNDSTSVNSTARVYVDSDNTQVALFAAGSNYASSLITNGLVGNVATLRTLGSDALEFGTSNTLRGYFSPSSSVLNLVGTATGDSSTSQLTFLDSGHTQIGYVGDASSGNSDLLFYNTVAGAGLRITEGGSIQGGASAGVEMTPQSGTFNLAIEICWSTTPTVTVKYYRIGDLVVWSIPFVSATSDSSNCGSTGTPVPAALRPTVATCVLVPGVNNGTTVPGVGMLIQASGDVSFWNGGAGNDRLGCGGANMGWTGTGAKAFFSGAGETSISYVLNN